MFKIHTIGGYNEVGKNMTAIDFGDDIIVFDCGLFIPAVVDLQETEKNPTPKMLNDAGALPDDLILEGKRDRVRAILITHAHLDHVGAVQHMASKFPNAQIYGTPFTIEVLKTLMQDSRTHIKNKINVIHPDNSCIIKGAKRTYKADFVSISHSTIQSTFIALHTHEGLIVYANDFKLDNNPIVGSPPNYKKMRELAKKGIRVLIMDSLYSGSELKTPSEKIARALVEEVLLTVDHKGKGIIVTTFSSHIARLKSIVDFSKKLGRKVVFVGRSLNKYVGAAQKIHQCPFKKDIELITYKNQVNSKLKMLDKEREKYVIVCTGHQGEPGSVLDRLAAGKLPFNFKPQDAVIFSSKVIPAPVNLTNRVNLEKKLKNKDVRIFDHVHVSGHGGREDLRELINILKPTNIIPAHGSLDQLTPAVELAKELGYIYGKNCFLAQDGNTIFIK